MSGISIQGQGIIPIPRKFSESELQLIKESTPEQIKKNSVQYSISSKTLLVEPIPKKWLCI
ncbi:hypothetical protein D5018_16410 [Parashewanella curva]|uniref:Uncharacterized protein n=1 Tax=Parashewanella curva TaxID=2338552 RepID=A0A3L8PVJ9_9GAMM|nr:hypothetical protein D5018_16410 [Parashewanella curva]